MGGKMLWIFPVISLVMWIVTLLTLLIQWCVLGRPHFSSMEPDQSIAFISDVGASGLKPLFITGCCITALSLVLSLLSERWQFSHAKAVQKSRLNSVFAILSIGSAVGGSLGLILLSILDVVHYRPVHQVLLIVAIVGYLLSAVFLCAERRSLRKNINEHILLSVAFYIKVLFIVLQVAAGCGFIICFARYNDAAGVLEWIVASLSSLYALAILIDLLPGVNRPCNDGGSMQEEISQIVYSNGGKA